MIVRPAVPADAEGIAKVLQSLFDAGKRTKPSNANFALSHYINHPDRVECSVAVNDPGRVLGFQSLKIASIGNIYDVTVGWGVIGTHINPNAARQGIGNALFRSTLAAAKEVNIPSIDATIGATNAEGLAYYSAMGFQDYRVLGGAICKRYQVN